MYADIIIDITNEKLDRIFQYRVPEWLEQVLHVGMEVVVPFGRGNHERHGYVVGFSETCDYEPDKMKEILRPAEKSVAIESHLVELAAWMKEQYGGTMIQALRTVLPIKKTESQTTEDHKKADFCGGGTCEAGGIPAQESEGESTADGGTSG